MSPRRFELCEAVLRKPSGPPASPPLGGDAVAVAGAAPLAGGCRNSCELAGAGLRSSPSSAGRRRPDRRLHEFVRSGSRRGRRERLRLGGGRQRDGADKPKQQYAGCRLPQFSYAAFERLTTRTPDERSRVQPPPPRLVRISYGNEISSRQTQPKSRMGYCRREKRRCDLCWASQTLECKRRRSRNVAASKAMPAHMSTSRHREALSEPPCPVQGTGTRQRRSEAWDWPKSNRSNKSPIAGELTGT